MSNDTTGSPSRLLVVETRDQRPAEPAGEVFVIEDAVTDLSLRDHDRVFAALSNADIDLGLDVPVYDIAWPHIISSRRGNLLEMVLTYQRLETEVAETAPGCLVCGEAVDQDTRAVVTDVAERHDIDVETKVSTHWSLLRLRRLLVSSLLMLPFLFDQLFSLVWTRLIGRPDGARTLFVPALGRLDSTRPVFKELSDEYEVLIASMASSWGWKYVRSGLDEFDPVPVSAYTSLRCLRRQLGLWAAVGYRALVRRDLESELKSLLASEFGVEMDAAVVQAVQNTFRTRMFTSLFLYPLSGSVIDRADPEQVVVGSMGPDGKAIVERGIAEGLETYHIPHSLAVDQSPNPPAEITQFVAGERDREFFESTPQVEELWTIVVTGRPYLTELYGDREEYATDRTWDGTDGLRVLLATQPKSLRTRFAQTAIERGRASDVDVEFVIKPHPSEDPSTYAEFESEDVTVETGGLFERIGDADLTMTMNSNAGLESVILGTPCACINKFEPLVLRPAYATGPIPSLRTDEAIDEFFDSLDPERLQELGAEQDAFVRRNYELESDAARNIADSLSADP